MTNKAKFIAAALEENGCPIAAGLLPHQHQAIKNDLFLRVVATEGECNISAGAHSRGIESLLLSPRTLSLSPLQAVQRLRERQAGELHDSEQLEKLAINERLSLRTRFALIDSLHVISENELGGYGVDVDDAKHAWRRIAIEIASQSIRPERLRRWFSLLEMLSPAAFQVLMWCPDMRAIAESRESLAGSAS